MCRRPWFYFKVTLNEKGFITSLKKTHNSFGVGGIKGSWTPVKTPHLQLLMVKLSLKTGWVKSTHWMNRKRPTWKQVGKLSAQCHNKHHPRCSTYGLEGTPIQSFFLRSIEFEPHIRHPQLLRLTTWEAPKLLSFFLPVLLRNDKLYRCKVYGIWNDYHSRLT